MAGEVRRMPSFSATATRLGHNSEARVGVMFAWSVRLGSLYARIMSQPGTRSCVEAMVDSLGLPPQTMG